jgi:4-hydroxy-tetrahydrodipicolinate synthase
MTALVTPFHRDGQINWAGLDEIVDFQVESGISGLVVTAGSGEYITLRPDERAEVVRRTVAAARGRVPVIAGILAPDTGSAVMAARAAQDAGAQGLLLLTPYYVSPSVPGIIEHFRTVSKETTIPIILYNIPGRTGINLDAAVIEALAEIPLVAAIKECDRDLGRVAGKMRRVGSRLPFLCGDDDLLLPFLSLGAPGAIMAGSNLVAPLAVAIHRATLDDRWSEARRLFCEQLLPFVGLFLGPDHPSPLKQMLGLAGFEVGCGRPPLQRFNPQRLSEVAVELRKLGLIE